MSLPRISLRWAVLRVASVLIFATRVATAQTAPASDGPALQSMNPISRHPSAAFDPAAPLVAPSSLLNGLVDYWKFDEAAGNLLGAYAGKTFVESGAVGVGAGKVYTMAREYGGPGTSNRHERNNNDVRFGDVDFTIALWWQQYTTSDGASPRLYHYLIQQEGYDGGYTIGLNHANQLFFQSGRGNGQTNTHHSTPINTPNQVWHFAVIWFTASDRVLHSVVDNGPEETTTGGARAIGTNVVRIGGDSGVDNTMDGRIGPLMMWRRTLNADERAQLWNNGNGLTFEALQESPTAITLRGLTATSSNTAGGLGLVLFGAVGVLAGGWLRRRYARPARTHPTAAAGRIPRRRR